MVDKGESIGESWEISSLAGSVSVVADGVDAGLSILQLIARDKECLLGRRNYERHGNEFPLLVKFIDAEKDLSIQVHPDDAMHFLVFQGQIGGDQCTLRGMIAGVLRLYLHIAAGTFAILQIMGGSGRFFPAGIDHHAAIPAGILIIVGDDMPGRIQIR